jgi:hypothetical protein
MNGSLVRYDAMINAIVACHSVDEVKDYRDKAMALEAYAKIAMNVEAERQACEVRLRAERRAGELFGELERAPTAHGGDTKSERAATVASRSAYAEALERTGTKERTARRYQELASVPRAQFEDALRAPVKPSTNGILRAANGSTSRMDSGSLWLWGTLRDWERDGHLDRGQAELFGGMTETMQADVQRVAPRVIDWLTNLLRGSR